MVRRLPWEQAADNVFAPPPSSIPARRRPKPIIDSSDIEQTPHKPSRTRNALSSAPIPEHEHEHEFGHTSHRARSASAPLGPPEEVFMVDGFLNDDRYRMVEDEFLDIAKEYTQHLHAAEYLRLKAAARNKSSATIGEISRPVVGAQPDATKRKLESVERAKRQAEAVNKLKREKAMREEVSEPEAPEPWLGTALQGLMEEGRDKVGTITDVVDTASASKAAKGYRGNKVGRMDGFGMGSGSDTDQAPPRAPTARPNQKLVETESEDDDLDAPAVAKSATTSWQRKLPVVSSPPPIKKEVKPESDLPLPPRRNIFTPTPTSTSTSEASVKKEDEDVIELPRTSADILARMAKRRELARRKREREEGEARRREEQEGKKRKAEKVIPTFL